MQDIEANTNNSHLPGVYPVIVADPILQFVVIEAFALDTCHSKVNKQS